MITRGSTAVMARRVEPHDSLDDFPTPPWATRALCEFIGQHCRIDGMHCWEPAANRGFMVRPLAECFEAVYASDVCDYGAGYAVRDFLWPGDEPAFDWIITNPPFRLGMEFALTALDRARCGVALITRTAFLEGGARYEKLFGKPDSRPSAILQFCERVPMLRGRVDEAGSTATAYCWIIWYRQPTGQRGADTVFAWVPPGSRRKLERPGDYEVGA